MGQHLQTDTLVVLKSTVSPGTTETLVKSILEAESGLTAGREFGLAFMPETVFEGSTLHDLRAFPRIVGGVTGRCAQAAANVFSVFPAPVHIYENPRAVEAAKLFMNIYRDTNIALVNELAMICERLGIDVMKAIHAANVDRKTHLLIPGLVGGYCLPKDTYYLASPAARSGYTPRLITTAREVNQAMAEHVLDLVTDVFEEMGVALPGAKIAVLGLGFKANNGSLRNTQAVPIVNGLRKRGAQLVAHDPFVRLEEVKEILPGLTCVEDVEQALHKARCCVIVTNHSAFYKLTASDMKTMMRHPCAIVDARHIIDPKDAAHENMAYRGLGKPVHNSV